MMLSLLPAPTPNHQPTRILTTVRRIGFTLLACIVATSALASRSETVLHTGWKFVEGDPANAETKNFNDTKWTSVRVPHTWNVNAVPEGRKPYNGPAWYRLQLKITPAQAKKRLFLRFAAASRVAKIFLNGKLIGEHNGGFSAFCLPLPNTVKPGENLLAVRVDNSLQPDVAPLSGDFTVFGGLYREVRLITLEDIAIDPTDDGGPGVYLNQTVTQNAAEVEVKTHLTARVLRPIIASVHVVITDQNGHRVAESTRQETLDQNGPVISISKVSVPNPHLWDGVRDPYLYRARIEVLRDGKVVDRVDQPLGFRTFRVDPAQGMILNGRPYDLHGVNIHQGRLSVAWAVTPKMEEEDYKLVRELGCTGVRMCHYQHGEHEIELCDKLGLVAWAELPLVNKASDTPAFRQNAAQQLRELVKQNFNHPSFVFLSLFNEPWIDKTNLEAPWEQVKDLVKLGHELAPSRLVTGAMNWGPDFWLTWSGDVAAFNEYWGWYGGKVEDWPKQIDALQSKAGGKTFGMSEYGAGASINQHEVPVHQPEPGSHWHPEEWQSKFHEAVWPTLAAKPWMWCKFVWVMFDFNSDGRNEGDRPGINDKGLVAGDHRTKKDAFYYYQAQWTDKPFVHITSARFTPRPAGTTEIRVYSNCSTVTLWLDGKRVGDLQKVAPGVFCQDKVPLSPGKHQIEVRGTTQGKTVVDRCHWTAVDSPPALHK